MSNQFMGARWLGALTIIASCAALACSPAAPTDPNTPDDTIEPTAPTADATAPTGEGGAPKEEIKGAKAPDFTLPTLDGDSVSLSDYQGKNVVLLDFWATHCDPCLAEMPELVELYNKRKAEGLIVLAVSTDDPDTAAKVPAMVKKYKMNFPILLDEDGSDMKKFNPKSTLPFTMVIARNGVIVGKRAGYQPGDEASMKKLISWIDRALAAK